MRKYFASTTEFVFLMRMEHASSGVSINHPSSHEFSVLVKRLFRPSDGMWGTGMRQLLNVFTLISGATPEPGIFSSSA